MCQALPLDDFFAILCHMKAYIVSFLLVVFTLSCAHRSVVEEGKSSHPRNSSTMKKVFKERKQKASAEETKKDGKAPKSKRSHVFWRLVQLEEMTLIVQGLDKKSGPVSIPLTNSFSYHYLDAGEWQVTGFKLGDKTFKALNTTQKMTFKVAKKSFSYAGAIIVHCPKVGIDLFPELKTMKFFNRYAFSSFDGLCEMVVGNDFYKVEEEWKKDPQSKKLLLKLGL